MFARFVKVLLVACLFITPMVGGFETQSLAAVAPSPAYKVATLAALKNTSTTYATTVYVEGRTTKGDGGEGYFYWLSGDQSANAGVLADTLEGVYIKPTSPGDGSTGVWKRALFGPLEITFFGAKGDSGTTDNASIINSALAFSAATDKRDVHVPAVDSGGYYKISVPLVVPSGVRFYGDGYGSFILNTTTTTSWASAGMMVGNYAGAGNPEGILAETYYDCNDITAGSYQVTTSIAADAGNFSPGDFVFLYDPHEVASFTYLYMMGNEVIAADGGTGVITLKHRVIDNYTADGGTAVQIAKPTGTKVGLDGTTAYIAMGTTVENLRLEIDPSSTYQVIHTAAYETRLRNLWLSGATPIAGNPFSFSDISDIVETHSLGPCNIAQFGNNFSIRNWIGSRTAASSRSSSSGFLIEGGGQDVLLDNIRLSERVVGGAGSSGISVSKHRVTLANSQIFGDVGGSAVSYAGTFTGGKIINNTISADSSNGIAINGASTLVEGNFILNADTYSIKVLSGAEDNLIRNNICGKFGVRASTDTIYDENGEGTTNDYSGNKSILTQEKQVLTSASAYTGTTSEDTQQTFTITAGTTWQRMGWRFLVKGFIPNASTAGTKDIRIKHGTTVIGTVSFSAAQVGAFEIEVFLTQKALYTQEQAIASENRNGTVTMRQTAFVVDSRSVDQVITLTTQLGSSGDIINIQTWIAEPVQDQVRFTAG